MRSTTTARRLTPSMPIPIVVDAVAVRPELERGAMLNLQSTSRRLPIYLLVDTSHSMTGPPIEAVNNGLQEFAAVLRSDNHAVESAYISVITFHDTAQQIVPLT